MIKIIITDDHPVIREGLRKIIKADSEFEVIGDARNAHELHDLLCKEVPDLVLLDISMPMKNGLEVLKEIKQIYPNLSVIMLTMHPEDRFAVRALKAGASGYLTKSSVPSELMNAIRTVVIEKRKYISTAVAEQLANLVGTDMEKSPHEDLSDREFEVMLMIASGKKVSDIARELSLSVRTVHTYRARTMQKLRVKSNVDLTRYAVDHNLIN